MSIIGTGIAAGVANTGQVAKQAAATNSGKEAHRAGSQQQTDKLTLSQLHDAGATRDTDQDMPDGQAPGYEDAYQDGEPSEDEQSTPNDQIHAQDAPPSSPTHLPLPPSYGPANTERHPLFHEIDLKA